MKIGVFLGVLDRESGGAFTFQSTLISSIEAAQSEHEFVFLYYGEEDAGPRTKCKVVRLHRGHGTRLGNVFQKPYTLEQANLDHSIDMVWFVIQDFEQVQCPYIYTIWDLQHRLQPWFPECNFKPHNYAARESHADHIRRASAVISANKIGAQELQLFYGIPEARILPLHHPTPEFVFHTAPDFSLADKITGPYLFYPAQYWSHKNHVCLMAAVALLNKKSTKKFQLVCSGANKNNRWHVGQFSEQVGVADVTHHLGFVTEAQLVGLYQKAFALCYPSFFGPENLPPLEAMALGTPTIVAEVAGAKEQYGDATLYFDPTDESALVSQIERLMKDETARTELIGKGKALVQSRRANQYVQAVIQYMNRFAKIRRTWY